MAKKPIEKTTWYRVNSYSCDIESVVVTAETVTTVTVEEEVGRGTVLRRSNKRSDWRNHFRTEREAVTFLVDREERTVKGLASQMAEHIDRLAEIKRIYADLIQEQKK